jgi:hypothetical protein
MWYYHLRKWFLLDVCVYLVFYALWIVYVDWTASTTARAVSDGMETSEGAIAVSLLILNSLFALKEAVQSARSGGRASYFRSPWNVIDFVCIVLVYSYILVTVTRGGAGNGLVPLVVFATLFLTLKLLAYLRGFGDTGTLILVWGWFRFYTYTILTDPHCTFICFWLSYKDGSFQYSGTTCGTYVAFS